MAKNVTIKKDVKPTSEPGVHYRLLCMTGKNKGISYYINGNRMIMGRSDKVDVQVVDIKASREHAELKKMGDTFVITDLGSQNGIIVNDLKVSQHVLSNSNKIIIGQTVYKFNIIRNKSQIPDLPVDEEEDNEEKEERGKTANPEDKVKKKKMLIYGIVLIAAVFFLFGPEEGKKSNRKTSTDRLRKRIKADTSLNDSLKNKATEETKLTEKKVNTIIHRGLREYREGNFFRAIAEFNSALNLAPNHNMASFYLNRVKQDLDDEIKKNFFRSRRSFEALKYDEARVSNCEIQRLLVGYEDDERYIEATNNLKEIQKILDEDPGSNPCGAR